ncbi:MAG TPA: HYR domain-containing protein, partial [Archangium sp.]|nr:HYR domain-containing protein [Archangium sp.]
ALPAGGSAIATVSVTSNATGSAEVWAVVDDDGTGTGTLTECREDNNGASAMANVFCAETTPANKPPVALCRDVTVHADASCQGTSSVNNGSYDPDNGPSPLSISEVPYTSLPLGTHPVTLTASDGAASDQCVGNVTVVDNSKPAVSCPASQVLETCSPAGAPATFAASATDTCGPATLSCSYASGSTFPVGDTAVSCSAKDGAGNTASCGFNVKVTGDITPPVISCPTSPIVIRACAPSGTRVDYTTSATDNCGEVAVNCSHPSGSTFPVGETAVTCSTQDVFGNVSTCGFSVVVGSTAGSSDDDEGDDSGDDDEGNDNVGGDNDDDGSGVDDGLCGYCNDGAPVAGADKGVQMWPPNHKYVTLSRSDCAQPATDSCGNPLPLDTYGHVLRVTSDEVEDANGNGDGRTCEDMSIIVGKSFVQLRSEREGTGDGRVYTIHYAITNDAGLSTQATCRVIVPHDQSGRTVVDSGVKYCVGAGCPEGTTEGSPLCK